MSAVDPRGRVPMRPTDLPTLQKLFETCDRSLLKRVILEDFACRDACVDGERRRAMKRRLDATLDAMVSLRAEKRPNKGWVLMPRESYVLDARKGVLLWRLHAALVLRCDIAAAERLVRAAGAGAQSYAQVKKAEKRLHAFLRDARDPRANVRDEDDWGERSYALSPWEHVLGTRVWLGGDWCRRERYLALASAFWEMTFYGFEYDRVQARTAQKKAALLTGIAGPADGIRKGKRDPLADGARNNSDRRAADCFSDEALECLARRVAVLNHQARCAFFEQMLDLAHRLEGR